MKHAAQKCFILANEPSCNNLGIWFGNFTKLRPDSTDATVCVDRFALLIYFRSNTSSVAIFFQNLTKKKLLYFYRLSVHRGIPVTIIHDALNLTIQRSSLVPPPPPPGPGNSAYWVFPYLT